MTLSILYLPTPIRANPLVMARNSKGFYVHKRVGYVPDKRNYKHSHANEQ